MPDRYGDRDDDVPPRGVASTVGDYDPTPTELAAFVAQARLALELPCRFCNAQPGQPCHNGATGQPARKFIAHPARIADTQDRVPPPTPDATPLRGTAAPSTHDDEELF